MNTAVAVSPKRGQGLAKWEDFESELAAREQSIAALLPQHVSKHRFMSSAVAAVKQTPELLTATPRSLFGAVTKSAQDGLLPDGREGIITIYREKQKDGSYANVAQWNPMIFGLRKRARELDDIIVNAQVVHEGDHFERSEGDSPTIEHKPAKLGTPRGTMIGAYAIFRKDDAILHREVMDAEQIEAVRAQSKAPDSLMWKKFTQEAWRKTVVRRGFKSVPCSENLETIIRRDDDLFNFDAASGNGASGTAAPKIKVVQPSAPGERRALPPMVGGQPSGKSPDQGASEPVTETPDDGTDRNITDLYEGEQQEGATTELAPELARLKSSLLRDIGTLESDDDFLIWARDAQEPIAGLPAADQAELQEAFAKRQDDVKKNNKRAGR